MGSLNYNKNELLEDTPNRRLYSNKMTENVWTRIKSQNKNESERVLYCFTLCFPLENVREMQYNS